MVSEVIVVGGGLLGSAVAYGLVRQGAGVTLFERNDRGQAPAPVLECQVELRPVSVDGQPILGQVLSIEGCCLATGYGAGGWLLGPWSAHLVASEVLSGQPEPSLTLFRPDRFRTEITAAAG